MSVGSTDLAVPLLLAVAGCLLPAPPVVAAEGIQGNLAGVDWLAKNLKSSEILILDTSPATVYAAKHIPGAVSVDLFAYGLPNTAPAEMEKRFQAWGVSAGKRVVIYDAGAGMMATRVFFSFLYYGYPAKDLLILDGGLAKWEERGLPVAKEPTPAPKPGTYRIGKLNEGVQVELPEFLIASGDTAGNVLLEALGADWHYGQVVAFNRAGHIPNGILLPSADFYNSDKTFKSAEEIGKMLTYLGIRPEQRIYTYCGGGVAASVPFFALKYILNYPKVKLYTESELGWLSDERQLPYWTYDAPFLMRDSSWLQFWSGPRIRSIGLSRVSVVDVRAESAFRAGHVPLALNLPGEVLRSHIGDPGKLAEILGPAGVNPAHEAVVVSGAGLTKDAALGFVMLENAGQKKVSIFTDSMDAWTRLGYPVTKDAAAPGTPAASYAAKAGKPAIIADPRSTKGVYPKVFIAAGERMPARAPEGKIVHLPYSGLLTAAGTPREAKDIWAILTKAGVPRYAELICVADDPGEAAVDYFIFRLMGYPDVKVLARNAD